MRKLTITLLLTVSFLTTVSLLAYGASESDKVSADRRAELLKAREAVWRAWFGNDQAALEKVLPDDTIGINNGEEKWQTTAEVLKSAADSAAAGTHLVRLEFPRTEIQKFGDVAVLYSLWTTDTETNGQHTISSGRSTEVFVFRHGRWLNIGWHADSGK